MSAKKNDRPDATESSGGLPTRIENALAILRAFASAQSGSVKRHVVLAVETLEAAAAGLDELEQTLDMSTDVDLDAVHALQDARRALADSERKRQRLEMQLAESRARVEADEAMQTEQKQRLQKLEKKTRDLDDVLANDPAAFDAYMKKTLGAEPSPGGKRKGRR